MSDNAPCLCVLVLLSCKTLNKRGITKVKYAFSDIYGYMPHRSLMKMQQHNTHAMHKCYNVIFIYDVLLYMCHLESFPSIVSVWYVHAVLCGHKFLSTATV